MGLIDIEGEHSVLLSSPHSIEIFSFPLPRFIFWWFSEYNGSVGTTACTFYTYHDYYISKHLFVGKGQFVYKLTTTPSSFYSMNVSLPYLLWRIMPHKQEIGWRQTVQSLVLDLADPGPDQTRPQMSRSRSRYGWTWTRIIGPGPAGEWTRPGLDPDRTLS